MSEESEEVPPEECPPGYEWDWEQGKCIVPDPSDDWWEGTDSGEDSIPSDGLGGSISFGLMIASLFQGAQGARPRSSFFLCFFFRCAEKKNNESVSSKRGR